MYAVAVRPNGNYGSHVSFHGIPSHKIKDVKYWTDAYEYQQQVKSDSRLAARWESHGNPDNDTKIIVPDLEPIESDDDHMGSMSPQNQKPFYTAKRVSSDDDPMGSMSPQNQKIFRGRKSQRARFKYSVRRPEAANSARELEDANSARELKNANRKRGFFARERISGISRGRGRRRRGLSKRRFPSTKPTTFSNVNQGHQNIYIYNAPKDPLPSHRLYGGIGPAPTDQFRTPQTKPQGQIRGAPKPERRRKSRALK